MNPKVSLLVKLLVVVAIVAMIFSVPLREFLKITFILGIPVIFLLGFMKKKEKYSLVWIVSLAVVIGVVGIYGYMLTQLPERIEVRKIIIDGTVLETRGEYEGAIAKYSELEKYDKKDKMEERIQKALAEQQGEEYLEEAKKLIEKGSFDKAETVLNLIEPNTRAYKEAQKLRRETIKE